MAAVINKPPKGAFGRDYVPKGAGGLLVMPIVNSNGATRYNITEYANSSNLFYRPLNVNFGSAFTVQQNLSPTNSVTTANALETSAMEAEFDNNEADKENKNPSLTSDSDMDASPDSTLKTVASPTISSTSTSSSTSSNESSSSMASTLSAPFTAPKSPRQTHAASLSYNPFESPNSKKPRFPFAVSTPEHHTTYVSTRSYKVSIKSNDSKASAKTETDTKTHTEQSSTQPMFGNGVFFAFSPEKRDPANFTPLQTQHWSGNNKKASVKKLDFNTGVSQTSNNIQNVTIPTAAATQSNSASEPIIKGGKSFLVDTSKKKKSDKKRSEEISQNQAMGKTVNEEFQEAIHNLQADAELIKDLLLLIEHDFEWSHIRPFCLELDKSEAQSKANIVGTPKFINSYVLSVPERIARHFAKCNVVSIKPTYYMLPNTNIAKLLDYEVTIQSETKTITLGILLDVLKFNRKTLVSSSDGPQLIYAFDQILKDAAPTQSMTISPKGLSSTSTVGTTRITAIDSAIKAQARKF